MKSNSSKVIKIIAGLLVVIVCVAAVGTAIAKNGRQSDTADESSETPTEETDNTDVAASATDDQTVTSTEDNSDENIAEAYNAEDTDDVDDVTQSTPSDGYQSVLEEYKNAMADSDYTQENYPNVSSVVMGYYHIYGGQSYYYAYYDINADGNDELLIGAGTQDYIVLTDLYTCDGTNAVKGIDEDTLGDRSALEIYANGTMVVTGAGSASEGTCDIYTIAEDGFTVVLNASYKYTYSESGDVSYTLDGVSVSAEEYESAFTSYTGGEEVVIDFDWTELD